MRIVFLDAGPLGLISNPRGLAAAVQCRQWVKDLSASGVRVMIPEIADYEVRRELIRAGKSNGLRRLDQVNEVLDFAPITSEIMVRAAELWAQARKAGRTTAHPEALDGDCILAATAILTAEADDEVVVATANVSHVGLFVVSRPWEDIAP